MTFLETLRSRLDDARSRLQETQDRLQIAQTEHMAAQRRFQHAHQEFQLANTEFNAFNAAFDVESKREAAKVAEALEAQTPLPLESLSEGFTPAETAPDDGAALRPDNNNDTGVEDNGDSSSRTQLVRKLINESHGITPAEMWELMKTDIKRRAYLYSILARLKERKQVTVRRGKYYRIMSKAEESATVQ